MFSQFLTPRFHIFKSASARAGPAPPRPRAGAGSTGAGSTGAGSTGAGSTGAGSPGAKRCLGRPLCGPPWQVRMLKSDEGFKIFRYLLALAKGGNVYIGRGVSGERELTHSYPYAPTLHSKCEERTIAGTLGILLTAITGSLLLGGIPRRRSEKRLVRQHMLTLRTR